MPRPRRSDFAGCIYHALNRGNARSNIFFKAEDYEAFERVIKEGLKKYPCLLYTSPSPRDGLLSRMPSSA